MSTWAPRAMATLLQREQENGWETRKNKKQPKVNENWSTKDNWCLRKKRGLKQDNGKWSIPGSENRTTDENVETPDVAYQSKHASGTVLQSDQALIIKYWHEFIIPNLPIQLIWFQIMLSEAVGTGKREGSSTGNLSSLCLYGQEEWRRM